MSNQTGYPIIKNIEVEAPNPRTFGTVKIDLENSFCKEMNASEFHTFAAQLATLIEANYEGILLEMGWDAARIQRGRGN